MEFLFENPFLLVILIGLISSLFKRVKGNQQEEQKKGRPRPVAPKPIVQDRREVPRHIDKGTRSQRTMASRIEREYKEKNKEEVIQKVTEFEKQVSPARNITEKVEAPRRTSNLRAQSTETRDEIEKKLTVDQQKLVDAVVWAEILGPPKAKKPYRSHISSR